MLKKAILAIGVATAGLFAAGQASADQHVHGYFRKNGTYVQPHYRSNPDGNVYNNYSTYPNVNPYTGQTGTHHYPTYHNYSSPSNGSFGNPSYGNHYRGW